jgi:hypothetical protein
MSKIKVPTRSLRMFEKRVLREVFGSKKDEMTRG